MGRIGVAVSHLPIYIDKYLVESIVKPNQFFILISAILLFSFGELVWSTAPNGSQNALFSGKLDGSVYSGNIGGKSSNKGDQDTLVFANGRLRSLMCDKLGFNAGIYATSTQDGKTYFVAETYSSKEGKIVWRGAISDGVLEATFEWVKIGVFGKSEKNYWFKGSLADR